MAEPRSGQDRIALPFVAFTVTYMVAGWAAQAALRPLNLRRETSELLRLRESMPQVTPAELRHAYTLLHNLTTALSLAQGPIYVALLGVALWGFVRLAGARWAFRGALRASVVAGAALVARQIALFAGAALTDLARVDSPDQLSLSPARYVNPDSQSMALLSSLDVFSLVLVALLAFAIVRTTTLSRRQAVGVAVLSWGVWLVPKVL
ncbi:MAG: hypothetical protein ABJE47_12810 [bacterium]